MRVRNAAHRAASGRLRATGEDPPSTHHPVQAVSVSSEMLRRATGSARVVARRTPAGEALQPLDLLRRRCLRQLRVDLLARLPRKRLEVRALRSVIGSSPVTRSSTGFSGDGPSFDAGRGAFWSFDMTRQFPVAVVLRHRSSVTTISPDPDPGWVREHHRAGRPTCSRHSVLRGVAPPHRSGCARVDVGSVEVGRSGLRMPAPREEQHHHHDDSETRQHDHDPGHTDDYPVGPVP